MPDTLKQKTVKGIGWSAIERFSVQGVNFLIQLVLARLLAPSDYGIIAMLAIFMQVAQVFIDSGFANALIQKQNCTESDYSTVFFYNLAISAAIYIVFYFTAPLVANFYKEPILTKVMRVISLTLILNALSIVQRTKLVKSVDFKTQTKVSLSCAILSGGIGIYMAYKGYGVWALCSQQVLNSLFQILFFQVYVRWIPRFIFSIESFRGLFNFGSRLLAASLISVVYNNLYTIVIGKRFSSENLGYYSRADHFSMFPASNSASIISRVTYPILSKVQDDDEKLKSGYRKIIRYSSFLIFPMMLGLLAVAEPFILVVLTEKWSGCISLMRILCLTWLVDHLNVLNLNLLYVKGRSDLVLKLEIIKKTIAISILFIFARWGVEAMCWGRTMYAYIALILNSYYTKKILRLSLWAQIKDFFPSLVASAAMAMIVYLTTLLPCSDILRLCAAIVSGVLTYSIIAILFFKGIIAEIISLTGSNKE